MDSFSNISEYYDNNPELVCGLFTCTCFNEEEKIGFLKELLGSIDNNSVLDLGCGNGGMYPYLKSLGCGDYLGIDLSENAIESLKLGYPNASCIKGDIQNSVEIAGANSWDIVVVCDVLEHCEDINKQLATCRRLLNPQGRLLISVPNYLNLTGLKKLYKEQFGFRKNSWAPFCSERPQFRETFMTSVRVRSALLKNNFRVMSEWGWDLVTALSFSSPYAENSLRGFWGNHGSLFGKLNRWFRKWLGPVATFLSLYYVVSAKLKE